MVDLKKHARHLLLSPLTRISFGLVMLTVSLLLISDMLGLIPDARSSELAYRIHVAENIAVQVSLEIGESNSDKLIRIVESSVSRNDRLQSIAVRKSNSTTLYATTGHSEHWTLALSQESDAEQMRIDLFSQAGIWGQVEVVFKPMAKSFALFGAGNSLIWIVVYIALAGFVAYFFFLKKVMKELDPEQALPDRVRTALDTLHDGLMILDADGSILFANKSLVTKTGFEAGTIIGLPSRYLEWITEDGGDTLPWEGAREGKLDSVKTTAQLVSLKVGFDKCYRFSTSVSAVTGGDDKARGTLVTFNDITEVEIQRAELEQTLGKLQRTQGELTLKNKELYKLATRDSLTGVYNRRAFFEAFDTLFETANTSGSTLGCIMVDIDHFKAVNDKFGHLKGDEVIRYLSDTLVHHASINDVVGRFGGEEFCLLVPDATLDEVLFRAESIRADVEASNRASFSEEFGITASFGVSIIPSEANSPQELIDHADKALYEAKESGRNKVVGWRNEHDSKSPDASAVVVSYKAAEVSNPVERKPEPSDRRKQDSLEVRPISAGKQNNPDASGAQVLVESDYQVSKRTLLVNRVDRSLKRAMRFDRELAVFVLDCSALLKIAETADYGLAVKIGSVIVDRIKNVLRSKDVVSQPEFDLDAFSVTQTDMHEIAVLISDVDGLESLPGILQRVLGVFEQRIVIDGFEYKLHSCVGASVARVDGNTAEDLLQKAALACSVLRSRSEYNQFLFYSAGLDESAKRELRIRNDLGSAIERQEIELHYQPKMDLESGALHGFEALIRWKHPDLNYIPPSEFIPIAEKFKIIASLNEWVVCEVASQLSRWIKAGLSPVPVAINLSAIELKEASLFSSLDGIITSASVPPELVEFEITESLGLDSIEAARETLEAFSKVGYAISVDDFGTGYASLSYLQRFPVDRLKIDRYFISSIGIDEKSDKVVRAVIMLGHSLGMRVLAEGVETEEQLMFLRNHHCDEIQGYLVSKPVASGAATAMLEDRSQLSQKIHAVNMELAKLREGSVTNVFTLEDRHSIVSTFNAANELLVDSSSDKASPHH